MVSGFGFQTFKLTHWGWVTHIYVGKLAIIAPDNGLSPRRRQAITWTNVGILLIGPLGTKFNEISIEIHTFSFKKMHLKMSSAKWRPFFLGLNVLSMIYVLNMSSQLGCSCILVLIEITIINIIIIIIINPYLKLKCKHCIQIDVFKTLGIPVLFKRSGCHKSYIHMACLSTFINLYNGVIKWKHFSRYRPFVRGIYRSPVNSTHTRGQVTRGFDVFFDLRLNKRVSKQSSGWWFETPSRPLWLHWRVDPKRDLAPLLMLLFRLDGTWCMFFFISTGVVWCILVIESGIILQYWLSRLRLSRY